MADYRKMWEELGMNVELHDQLCEVLPQAFGDVYLSQDNRPEGMDYYNFVVSEIHGVRPAELIEHQKKGMRLHRELKKLGVRAVIAPTPRVLSACCGISLLIQKKDTETVENCVKEHGIEILKIVDMEKDINPNRDRYC